MDCVRHRGGYSGLEEKMRALDENQGGAGRHKCPYCAYELGFQEGQDYALQLLADKEEKGEQDNGDGSDS